MRKEGPNIVRHHEGRLMKHIIVAREEGRFLGWPANDGVWSWTDEIVVGYTNGTYEFKEQCHRISGERPSFPALSRSRDGGESWQREEAASYAEHRAWWVRKWPERYTKACSDPRRLE